jgi:hypothetical protein
VTFQEKMLYHQIHPAKLATDIGVTFPACYLFWQHQMVAPLGISLLPPIIVSAVILGADVNLEPYKHSSFGRYLNTYMTRTAEAVRLLGFALMAIGCWFHQGWLLPCGLVVVLLAWLRGIIWRKA